MKKLPLAFSGCLLGLAGAGNLILDTFPLLSHVFSLSGLILWFYFLVSHLSHWQESKQELKKAPLLSGMATFPMAGMILSTYMLRTLPVSLNFIAQVLWWFAFLLDVGLIIYFTINYVQAKPRTSATPSWTVLYVGIAVASLTYPVVGIVGIAYGAWIFGFILTLFLYPLIYQDLKKNPLPLALLGQEGIYCAPFSLLLAALVRIGGPDLPSWILLVMVLASQTFFFLVLSRLSRILKQGFQPAFSALTFPTIITATSLKMAQGILQFPTLNLLVWIETIICLTILIYVLVEYVRYLRK
ncbi:C4-dicarboxylate ABC transporter [Streptococcus infantis]|uniref:C4-dicarboxylate transporter/malic acid transport protein n=1 Tax=Streptococcus infantis SK1076 TaxID=1005705 RepID=F5VZR8_9STRE|nr:TDT family transporter [Streptococcus infantis]EGL87100.1 C4-dicarboxylate transporter/malic acid transport protein [Streptococcus infantis SK1076]UJD03415.1 C4-dicarboxylate ABC transporter [Streptococcus infantis]